MARSGKKASKELIRSSQSSIRRVIEKKRCVTTCLGLLTQTAPQAEVLELRGEAALWARCRCRSLAAGKARGRQRCSLRGHDGCARRRTR